MKYVALLILASTGALSSGAEPPDPAAPPTTQKIFPPELVVNGPVLLRVHARGDQVYKLQKFDAGKLDWKLQGPEATLRGPSRITGRHYAGPTWELSDGSKVTGVKIAEHASDEKFAIPWLLLAVKSHEGAGLLETATYIQRINTTGGQPPPVGLAKEGDEIKIPYVADYVFYGPEATTRPAKN
jgi:hypothetical protein